MGVIFEASYHASCDSKAKNSLHANLVKTAVWALLALPLVLILARFYADTITYGEVIHQTGLWSVGCLLLALAATPLQRRSGKAAVVRFLARQRRALGVASFAYAAAHTAVYVERKWGADLIIKEGSAPDLATGWLALAIFLVLAITSNNGSVRRLGRNWKRLHRSVYVATLLVLAHWLLTTFEPVYAWAFVAALLVLQLPRLWQASRQS